jgi:hypothetical protein
MSDTQAAVPLARSHLPPESAAPRARSPIAPGALVIWLFAGIAFGVWLARSGLEFDAAALVVIVPAGLAAAWLQMLLHEGGHALAGLARGMHLFALGLGPLRIEQTRGGWRWHWSRNVAGIGGFAALSPKPGRPPRRIDQAIFLLGGVAANLLAAALILPFALDADAFVARALLWSLVGFGLLFGLVNLLPFRSAGWRSDGLTLIQLWRRPDEARAMQQIQHLVALSLAGVRPRDWPDAAMPDASAALDPAVRRSVDLLHLSSAIDRGRCADADELAARIAADYASAPDGVRQNQALMLATFAACCARSETMLAAWLPLGEGSLFAMETQREWLRAELAALRGAGPDASAHLAKARAALPRVHDAGTQTMLADRIATCERRLAAREAIHSDA